MVVGMGSGVSSTERTRGAMLSRPLASGHRSLLGTEEEEEEEEEEERFWLKETVNPVRYLNTIMIEPRGALGRFVRCLYYNCVAWQKKTGMGTGLHFMWVFIPQLNLQNE